MTIAATITALQAIHAGIAGVVSAPDGMTAPIPSQVESVKLPIVLLFPGKTDLTAAARNEIQSGPTYDGVVLVAGEAAGLNINGTMLSIWDLLQAFRDRYTLLVGTKEELVGGVVVSRYQDTGDTGGVVKYRNKRWAGFAFTVTCWEPD